ncbi:hypothetical protein ACFFWC_28225 [Plantactinospora siamensis]|uniref:Restriction endonuclease domain-containing protein n=1 Tax=Plantactinospora siamensis TaxID=555372 RepID=A0ABV6NS04_9ACTN
METLTFDYYLLWKEKDRTPPPVNVIIEAATMDQTQAVIWDRRTESWNFRPDVAVAILWVNREDHEVQLVDRATAEAAAPNFTTVPLPTEAELTEICREGSR